MARTSRRQSGRLDALASETKQTSRKGPLVGLAVLVVVLAVPVGNLLVTAGPTPVGVAAASHPTFAGAAAVVEGKCMDCHWSQAAVPWYGKVPVAGGMLAADMETGTRWFDAVRELTPGPDEPYGEAALAKLEYVVERQTMPPTKYALLHWNRGLSDTDRETILAAIRAVRSEHYATDGVADRFATYAIQPVPREVEVDAARAALGEAMYHDVRLSGDDTLSCASCHGLETGGCDQVPVSTGINGQKGPINAPTVYNAVFNLAQFWDGRAADLKEQAGGPVTNPIEMGASWDQVLPKLRRDQKVAAGFAAAYPDGLTADNITDAIAEFEKTLVTPDSAFDRYLKGDASAMNEQQIRGMHLFEENACANCHVGKAMGGRSYERMGRARDYFAGLGRPITDADVGRFNVTGEEADRHRFKVPVLRNVALTYPYFHDGSQTTLKGAVFVMAAFQGYRQYTGDEADAVVAFLEAQTGQYRGQPLAVAE